MMTMKNVLKRVAYFFGIKVRNGWYSKPLLTAFFEASPNGSITGWITEVNGVSCKDNEFPRFIGGEDDKEIGEKLIRYYVAMKTMVIDKECEMNHVLSSMEEELEKISDKLLYYDSTLERIGVLRHMIKDLIEGNYLGTRTLKKDILDNALKIADEYIAGKDYKKPPKEAKQQDMYMWREGVPILNAEVTYFKSGDGASDYFVGEINEEKGCIAQGHTQEEVCEMLKEIYWMKKYYENRKAMGETSSLDTKIGRNKCKRK